MKWIGVEVGLNMGTVKVTVDPNFVANVLKEIGEVKMLSAIPQARLRRLAGKTEWAAGIIPYMRSLITPLWAAVADVRHGTFGKQRVAHTLTWLEAFFSRRRGTLERIYKPDDVYGEELLAEFDASPWGYGGVLFYRGRAVRCFAEAISDEDVQRLGVKIGESCSQAILETMVVLVGVRAWAPLLGCRRWCVRVRSDSQAALGAASA